jgi:hypothetical protein
LFASRAANSPGPSNAQRWKLSLLLLSVWTSLAYLFALRQCAPYPLCEQTRRPVLCWYDGRSAMNFTHHDLQGNLDDAWWVEAGMVGFVPASSAYRADPNFFPHLASIAELRIVDVGPVSLVRR